MLIWLMALQCPWHWVWMGNREGMKICRSECKEAEARRRATHSDYVPGVNQCPWLGEPSLPLLAVAALSGARELRREALVCRETDGKASLATGRKLFM